MSVADEVIEDVRRLVTPEVLDRATAEIDANIPLELPPNTRIYLNDVRALMISSWVRGWSARGEEK
jgi:hypothetical protein